MAMRATSTAMRAGKPQASTIGPPTSGPRNAPSGDAPAIIERDSPRRRAGALSERVVIIRPLLPSDRLITDRASTKSQILPASIATTPANMCATNERTITGWRAKRSASAPQNGRNGRPTRLEMATIAPVHVFISAGSVMPSLGRKMGVKAPIWLQNAASTRLASVKSVSSHTQESRRDCVVIAWSPLAASGPCLPYGERVLDAPISVMVGPRHD